jgi:hypothetical protein
MEQRHMDVRALDDTAVDDFIRSHLPRCHCPEPHAIHPQNCHSALVLLLAFLRQTKRIKPPVCAPDSVIDRLVKRYDPKNGSKRSKLRRFRRVKFCCGRLDLIF